MNAPEHRHYLGSDDLTKFLNGEILKKCPELRNHLLEKVNTAGKTPHQINELLIRKLQEDESINFEALINEQMDCFYHLQPAQTTLDDNFYVLDKNKQGTEKSGGRVPGKREERGQSMLVPTTELNHKEMSFGNQVTLHGALGERRTEASGDTGEEEPRAESQLPSPEKPVLNPFRIRDTAETRIVPEPATDEKIYLKAPSILKASNNKAMNPDLLISNSNTDGVFYTDRDSTSARHRVDFDLESSQDVDPLSSFAQSSALYGETLNDRLVKRVEKNQKLKKLSALSQSAGADNQGGMLRRLVRALNESNLEVDAHSRLMDKTLTEFPVFALNDDYLKALSLILQDKMDHVRRTIDE